MNAFVVKKSCFVIFNMVATIAMVLSALSMGLFSREISDLSTIAALTTTGLIPIALFSTAFFYQRKVVLGLRQLSFIKQEYISELTKNLIESARITYEFTKYVPLVITIISMIIAVAVVPSSIAEEISITQNKTLYSLGCAIVSANLLLFFKMYNQLIFCYAQIKTESFL